MDDLFYRTRNVFHWSDYLVFALFLLISTSIGLYFSLTGGRQRSTHEYLHGNRDLSIAPVAISILVSFTSAILIVGGPAEIYLNGNIYLLTAIAKSLACIFAAIVFIPLFYPLKLTSSFEYLELRFKSKMVKLLGNICFVLGSILYMGLAMYAPSVAMEKVTGGAFTTQASMVCCGFIGIFYTTIGGIKAVVWTDFFQGIIMVGGILSIIIKGTIDVGGLNEVFRLNYENNRVNLNTFTLDPTVRHSILSIVVGGGVAYIGTYGTSQGSIQRFGSLPTLNKARLAVLMVIPANLILLGSVGLCGMVIFAFYASKSCDIHDAKWARKNEIVSYYVMDQLHYYCVPGLFMASLFSGALSSISSSLNGLSATTWKDILQPTLFKNTDDRKAAIITKLIVVIFGICGIAFGFAVIYFGGNVLQASIAFTGAVSTPLGALFAMGAFFPFINKWGALVGAGTSMIFTLWLSIGSYATKKQIISLPGNITNCYDPYDLLNNSTSITTTLFSDITSTIAPTIHARSGLDTFYSISYLYYTLFGVVVAIIFGVIISLITGIARDTDSKYITPICRKLWYCYTKDDELSHEDHENERKIIRVDSFSENKNEMTSL